MSEGISYSGKLSREKTVNWWKIKFLRRKLSRIVTFAALKDATPSNFAEKTFANSYKTAKFAKVFSLESFPLYGKHHHPRIVSNQRKIAIASPGRRNVVTSFLLLSYTLLCARHDKMRKTSSLLPLSSPPPPSRPPHHPHLTTLHCSSVVYSSCATIVRHNVLSGKILCIESL